MIFRSLGGSKNILARAILGFSLGLLFQSFGQASFSYYAFIRHVAVPYPSLGDIGFLGSIPCYIYGILQLAKASVGEVSLKSFHHEAQAFFIPTVMLFLSYYIFLRDYVFDWSNPLKVFLDFGYPLGDAIYVSIVILVFLLSRKIFGGTTRGPILFFAFALAVQYISDYTFLYQASHGTWQAGRINDLMYSIAYFLMTIGIIYVGEVLGRMKEMDIYGNHIVFASASEDSGLVVENPELAAALRKGFMAMIFKRIGFSV